MRPKLWLAAKGGETRGPSVQAESGVQASAKSLAPGLDDSELLAAVRSGSASAAAAFHDRTRPQVDRTIRRLLGSRDQDADDVAQVAMIELVYTIDRYRGECSLDAWTATLTAHVVYKHIRRRQTERRIFGDVSPDDLMLPSPRRAGREAMVKDVMEKVLVHLNAMDENRAFTYVLHDVCGYDLHEIAQIMSVSVAAAQSRLVRGRKELNERLSADPELSTRMSDLEGESQ